MFFKKICTIANASFAFAATLLENPFEVNTTNHVQLASYNYTSGTFNAEVFVHNDGYDKTVYLYYNNIEGESTPLTVLAGSFYEDLGNDWELWSISSPIYPEEGLTKLLNVTFNSITTDKTYSHDLDIEVEQEGEVAKESPTPSAAISPTGFYKDIDDWLNPNDTSAQAYKSKTRVFDNINVNGSIPGLVIAAQSYYDPDYGYHWIRDAGLTFDAIFKLYQSLPNRDSKFAKNIEDYFLQYIQASIDEQNDKTAIAGLGEPKFYLNNNTGYQGAWGRPQNDGPAIRAFAIMDFVKEYINKGGDKDYIINLAWEQPILKDLDFVVSNWTASNFDLWEEVNSDHFFTRFVQRKALLNGAEFASQYLKDYSTYKTLTETADSLTKILYDFIYPLRHLILTCYGPVQKGKSSYKDLSVILAINHAYLGDGVFAPTDDYVVRTVYEVATSFIDVYSLSNTTHDSDGLPLAPPTGRYPEDVYNGTGTSEGNPWYLSNAAFAEFFYNAASEFQDKGSITITNLTQPFWEYYASGVNITTKGTISKDDDDDDFDKLIQSLIGWGDAFLRVVKHYSGEDGHYAEEFDKTSGVPRGAKDLTWSYASILTASFARSKLKGVDNYITDLTLLE